MGAVTMNLSKSLLTMTGQILKLWSSNKVSHPGWGMDRWYVMNCHKGPHSWTQADIFFVSRITINSSKSSILYSMKHQDYTDQFFKADC